MLSNLRFSLMKIYFDKCNMFSVFVMRNINSMLCSKLINWLEIFYLSKEPTMPNVLDE